MAAVVRPDLPNVRFDGFDRVDEVRVATWPDGVEAWRTGLYLDPESMGPMVHLTFRTREEVVDLTTTVAMHVMGFKTGIIVSIVGSGPPVITPSSDGDLDRFMGHLRWLATALGLRGPFDSPIRTLGREEEAKRTHQAWAIRIYAADPLVFRLSMGWAEAREKARGLDLRTRAVQKWFGPEALRGSKHRFQEVAAQIGEAHLMIDAVVFLDDLVSNHWVKLASQPFQVAGQIQAKLLRRTSEEGDRTKGGYTTVSSLDQRQISSFVDLVDWLRSDELHPSVVVRAPADHDRWFEEHRIEGSLTIGPDEVEVFRMLGDPLPYVWPPAQFSRWAIERWGR